MGGASFFSKCSITAPDHLPMQCERGLELPAGLPGRQVLRPGQGPLQLHVRGGGKHPRHCRLNSHLCPGGLVSLQLAPQEYTGPLCKRSALAIVAFQFGSQFERPNSQFNFPFSCAVCKRWLRLSADETLWRRLDLVMFI